MPVLKNAAGTKPEIVLTVRLFDGCCIWTEKDLCRAFVCFCFRIGNTVKIAGSYRLHQHAVEKIVSLSVRIVLKIETIKRFFAVYYWPNETAALGRLIGVEVRKIMAVANGELAIFVEKGFLWEILQT